MFPYSTVALEMSAKELREAVERTFSRLDTNEDGMLTRDEFVDSCLTVSLSKACSVNSEVLEFATFSIFYSSNFAILFEIVSNVTVDHLKGYWRSIY